MTGNEQKYIAEAFAGNWIAPVGENIDEFENEIAEYTGAKGAVAVSSGTAAIHLALSLLNIKRGDTVFCSSLTFVATANPIVYQGAEPVFIDSEPDTWNMSPLALEKALHYAFLDGKLPKAVIIVNLYGQSAKYDELLTLCHHYGVPVIEDAAESLGSSYKGISSGTFGDFGIYSFNGNKIITTSGGGMLVSDDLAALDKVRYLATQARDPAIHYQHSVVGFNYRMSNILAGIGRGQLQAIEKRVTARRNIFDYYKEQLSPLPGVYFMPELNVSRTNRWLTALTINQKEAGVTSNQILKMLIKHNIEARPVWKPLHMQPLFKGHKHFSHFEKESLSEQLFHTGICLPSGSNLTSSEQMRVINYVKESFEEALNKEGIV
ncbi:aminotransferase class I/II-fold pyridoxal phosphate-dependent enzyme [Halobacillus amylolyticus]|uniref:Aminotransferase class I/II-fold pyridoxal phosphate-dependent enzyme n=2 Tax=Halobacillus amylolyticus TaxID=2932259 RepID=A0ABY4HH65_9BACI|nr:aminotransferase class I/II-fold pyridoxal phosphate-dependent enzyme [Halobacillus amylolyticus]UOR13969.1 aminotransferase class I/II-fold pyridoxal phosphate-dependent enzyme [Halobacillus amylolyticus]